LRTVKYGETSIVVSLFTELFGLQSYMVNGIRQVSKKGASKGSYFQPGALLDMVVYNNELKNLQRIKEYKWAFLFNHLFSDIFKNAVSLFMIELLNKCLKEPEPNNELFYFAEDALLHLDDAGEEQHYLDLQEGVFTKVQPAHTHYLQDREAEVIAHILKVQHPSDLEDLKLNGETRRRILSALELYYALHIPDFGTMKTLPVLREISS
jgi:DNA repair protein RecO (recombination protein O)